MKSLPIGISTLRTIVESDMVYIDKSMFAVALARTAGRYFLSRPRRFGKSLFIDTLQMLFEGEHSLFRGLAAARTWDWSSRYPVIRIDFSGGDFGSTQAFRERMEAILLRYADQNHYRYRTTGVANRLDELVGELSKSGNGVVLLVDEYDKPLLDHIGDPAAATLMREELKALYSVIKARDADLRFVFLTGVSKFCKVSIFSGINNLNDITLDERYAEICGYTQRELECEFAAHLEGVDLDELKRWYNGYNFLGKSVYNPFDILLFLDKNKRYRNYWFETGTPTFLIELFRSRGYFLPDLEQIEAGEDLLNSFELDQIEPVSLLFQTGYLTIDRLETRAGLLTYHLKLPNEEVRRALSDQLLHAWSGQAEKRARYKLDTWDALETGKPEKLEAIFRRLFAGVPWRNFTGNDIGESEGYYASVLYAFLVAVGCEVIPEDISNHGQADLTFVLERTRVVAEIKVVSSAVEAGVAGEPNAALEQIVQRDYSAKYRGRSRESLYEIGMIFGRAERNLIRFDYRKVAPDTAQDTPMLASNPDSRDDNDTP